MWSLKQNMALKCGVKTKYGIKLWHLKENMTLKCEVFKKIWH